MNSIQQNTINFVKASLTSTSPDIDILSNDDWQQIFLFAKENGILALCFDAINKLPQTKRPPQKLFLQWALSVENIKNRYENQKNTAQKLIAKAKNIDINIMIMKGLSISRYYPIPNLRECGDIDIYCYNNGDKLNKYIESLGVKVDYHNKRHSIFVINNTVVENHAYFLYNRDEEKILEKFLVSEAQNSLNQPNNQAIFGTPLGIAVFFLKHAEKHFVFDRVNIQLRTLCDWSMILQANNFQYSELKKVIAGTTIDRFADLLTYLCAEILQLPASYTNNIKPFSQKTLSKALTLILDYQHETEKRGSFVGSMQRLCKYLKYYTLYKKIFHKNIIKWYYFK